MNQPNVDQAKNLMPTRLIQAQRKKRELEQERRTPLES